MKSDHRDEGNHQFKSTINFVVCLSSTAFCLELRIVFTCQISKADPQGPNKYFLIQCLIGICQEIDK